MVLIMATKKTSVRIRRQALFSKETATSKCRHRRRQPILGGKSLCRRHEFYFDRGVPSAVAAANHAGRGSRLERKQAIEGRQSMTQILLPHLSSRDCQNALQKIFFVNRSV
jgi:hypothetical protein